jgi:hypothetical protein
VVEEMVVVVVADADADEGLAEAKVAAVDDIHPQTKLH